MIHENAVSVLLLEEEAIIALDVEFNLSQAGYTIAAVFSTSAGALDWLSDHSPGVAILDVRLKDGPSHHVARTLSERTIPFIVHSSICRPGDGGMPLQQGPGF
jgi:DNA-binding response OmpR family regulator